MSNATAVTTAGFDQDVLKSDIPVLVDFWAPWCPPCRAIGPTIDALAEEYAGKAKIVKVDIDQEPAIAERYGVQSIPTLIVFKGGEVSNQVLGAVPKDILKRMLDEAV